MRTLHTSMIEDLIYARLNDSTITTYVATRVYDTDVPENTTWPFVVYQISASETGYTMSGTSGVASYDVDITVEGTSQAQMSSIANAVKGRLSGYRGGNIQGAFLKNETDDKIADPTEGDIYQSTLTFRVYANPANIFASPTATGRILTVGDSVSLTACSHTLLLDCSGLTLDGSAVIPDLSDYARKSQANTFTADQTIHGNLSVLPTGGLSSIIATIYAGGVPTLDSSGPYPLLVHGSVVAYGSSHGWRTNDVTGDWQCTNPAWKVAFSPDGINADTFLTRNTSGGLLATNTAAGQSTLTSQPFYSNAVPLTALGSATRSFAVNTTVLTSNVATLTTTTTHNFLVGESVIVLGCGTNYNGSFTITAVTSNTFSYAKTHANIASASVSGSATVVHNANLQEWKNAGGTVGSVDKVGNATFLSLTATTLTSTNDATIKNNLFVGSGGQAGYVAVNNSAGSPLISLDGSSGNVAAESFSGSGSGLFGIPVSGLQPGALDTVLMSNGTTATWVPFPGGGGSCGSGGEVQYAAGSGSFSCDGSFWYGSGVLTAPQFSGDGSGISNLNYGAIQTGGNPDGYVLGISSGAPTWVSGGGGGLTSVDSGTASNLNGGVFGNGSSLFSDSSITTDGGGNLSVMGLSAGGTVSATSFTGDGSNLSNLTPANITTGSEGYTLTVFSGTPTWRPATSFIGNGVTATDANGIMKGNGTVVQCDSSATLDGSGNLTLVSVHTTGSITADMGISFGSGAALTGGAVTVQATGGTLDLSSSSTIRMFGPLASDQTSSGSTLGSVVGKMPIYDTGGSLVGYMPIYDSIT